MLIGVYGKQADSHLLVYALRNQPVLVLDCSNCANPHRFPVPQELLHDVHIVQVDLIYTFRDAIKRLPQLARRLGVRRIIITTHDDLFNYHDERENQDIFEHAYEMMAILGKTYDVLVGVADEQLGLARQYCQEVRGLR